MKTVIDFIKRNIENDSTLVIACSGGPDSMCLLDIINNLKEEKNLKVIIAHVNHKIRTESEEEAALVKKYSEEHNMIFEYLELNEYQIIRFKEEDARKKRYDFFRKTAFKYKANYLLTAHHGDDLIETILMRLTRGSNLSGYIGIKEISKKDNLTILRPLLNVTKEDIISYLNENNISYALDKTNDTEEHTRNRYRHQILPFLKKENKNVHMKYLKFSKELTEYDEFINDYIDKNKFIVDNKILINKLNKESLLVKRKCLERLIKKIQNEDYFDISDEQMKNLMSLYNKDNKSIDLNNKYQGINCYGNLIICKKNDKILNEAIIDGNLELNDFIFYYNSEEKDNTNSCICLNSKEISLPLKLRSYKEGDKMVVKNLNGTKKVSDIFIDGKIPKHKRSTYPILVDNKNTILWIPNLKKSQFSKDISEKCDIIIKCKAKENIK